jgi:hypothetical protein
MRLGREDFDRLARDARSLTEQSKTYLADVLDSLRQEDDPIATLMFLIALSGSPYARRNDQREAVDGVGRWLDERLRRDPGIAIERLRLELGWLRRMVIMNHAGAARTQRPPGTAHGPSTPQSAAFGNHLARLRQLRQAALGSRAQADARASARVSAPERRDTAPAPTLPEVFRVTFADINDLRKARKDAKKRAKNQQPAKDRQLALRPADATLAGLAADLRCWLLGTDGMPAVLAAMDAQSGIVPAFYVRRSDITDADVGRVVQRVALTPPPLEKAP